MVAPLLALAALATALVAPPAAPLPRPYELVQLNLCLSGVADCAPRTAYPAVLQEAEALLRAEQPAAVTVAEGCSGDVEALARATGYAAAFSVVRVGGAPLECTSPGGRGVFGGAVLVRGEARAVEDAPFAAQAGAEQRRSLCATGADGHRVCTAHLVPVRDLASLAANGAQCRELAAVLARGGPTAFGGDLNRALPCAPAGWSVQRDDGAAQAAGVQHAYGGPGSALTGAQVVPMARTDHDALVARGWWRPV